MELTIQAGPPISRPRPSVLFPAFPAFAVEPAGAVGIPCTGSKRGNRRTDKGIEEV